MFYLKGISEIEKNYEVFLIDQWGVIHDGFKKYQNACRAIKFLRERKKKIILISNSSQTASSTKKHILKKIGINHKLFNKIVTSGELFRYNIINKKVAITNNSNLKCYNISHISQDKYLSKLNIKKATNISEADFILASSIKPNEKLKNYIKILNFSLKKKIPMICTNPDKKVYDGNKKKVLTQVGTLAEYYQSKKGKVIYYGKPYPEIFKHCLKEVGQKKKTKVLLIGDSMDNDISGANECGIDSLLILRGVLKEKFKFTDNNHKKIISKILKLSNKKILPTYFSWSLKK